MIDPSFLDELDRFEVTTKRETDALRRGEQDSRRVGEGLTFSDFRRYAPGDDTRLVDWKVFARTDEYFVKQFEEERNLTVHVLLDSSASMDFGDGAAHKFEYGAKLALGYAYLTAEENNDFRFSTFGPETDRLDAGRSTRGELLRLIDLLNGTEPTGSADFARAFESYAGGIHSRSLVVIVSDFLADPDAIETGLAALSGNDVVLAQVLAPAELSPAVSGDTVFEDPETETSVRSYFGAARAEGYRDRLDGHVAEIERRGDALGATHALVDTGADFFESFASVWVG
ncbi:MAG: DUF58 domain-containing protein [Salinigranum sp.]